MFCFLLSPQVNELSQLTRGGMSHHDLATAVTSQSMMSRLSGGGVIGGSGGIAGIQASVGGPQLGVVTGHHGNTHSGALTAGGGDSGAGGGVGLPGHDRQRNSESEHSSGKRSGIQTSPDGRVTCIPPSMVTDQFGMIGLLTFIRAAETDPNLTGLALGADLTTLGLNLNSEVNLYPTFGGPWAETPCRPQDIDFHVPFEYLTNTTIR